jgi:hypothetical protein
MGSGGGSSDKFMDFGRSLYNYTLGNVTGYMDQNGKVKGGLIGPNGVIDEGIGEITGRNQARKQIYNAEDAARAEAAQREVDRQNELQKKYNEDLSASRSAASLRSTSGINISMPRVLKTGNVSSDTTDFLGL